MAALEIVGSLGNSLIANEFVDLETLAAFEIVGSLRNRWQPWKLAIPNEFVDVEYLGSLPNRWQPWKPAGSAATISCRFANIALPWLLGPEIHSYGWFYDRFVAKPPITVSLGRSGNCEPLFALVGAGNQRGSSFPFIHDLAQLLDGLQSQGLAIPPAVLDASKLTVYATAARYPALTLRVMQAHHAEAVEIAEDVLA